MRSLRQFLSHWQNWLSLFVVLTFAVVAIAAPLLSPVDNKTDGFLKRVGRFSDRTPRPPSDVAPLGTLPGQIDVYHALVWGSRQALQFGLSVAIGAFMVGVLYGSIAGYASPVINRVMMRIADSFLAFPAIAAAVFLTQLVAVTIESMGGIYWYNPMLQTTLVDFQFTPPFFAVFLMKVDPVLVSLVLFSWMPIARLVNTLVVTLKNTDFIHAVRALGGSSPWIIWRHIIPNSISPAIVLASRDVGNAVILQATLTFIGLGGRSAWGQMLWLGRNWVVGAGGDIFDTWWVFLPATLALMLLGFGWNLLGDGLSDIFTVR